MTTARALKPLFAATLAACALTLGGCLSIDPFQPDTDPTSAAQAAIAQAEAQNRPFPRWSDFPARPEGLVGPIEVAEDVRRLEGGAEALYAWARSNPPLTENDLAWAERTRGFIDPRLARPAPPNAVAEAEAFARRLRELAAPPPPVQ
jgi:hypothetical protein